jgi:uncharacterized repeat protein (TIGR03809 family)
MTQRLDVARGRDVLARWCNLAEQRLQYLTELFESGRWRRFHSETAFLENIREAKSAVETWRDLSTREASPDNSAVDVSWLGRAGITSLRNGTQSKRTSSQPIRFPTELTTNAHSTVAIEEVAFELDLPALESVPKGDNAAEPTRDVASIQERYPLLRNAL